MVDQSNRREPGELPTTLPRSPALMRACDTLLLIVDMQERLLAALPEAKRIVWNCRRLLDAANALGVRTVGTEQVPDKLGPTTAALAERLGTTRPAKDAFSCGACEDIASALNELQPDRVLVCGIETHVCVAQTACDLLADGYQVLVAVDAVSARFPIDHEYALRRLELSGALLTTTEAAMFEWCERADRPEFRQISALAKETLEPDS